MKDIPIFIANFNRFQPTKDLVESLLKRNYRNVTIVDNFSQYPPLLEWYKKCPVKVHQLNRNVGPYFLNTTEEFKYIIENPPYVLTDSDVVPMDEVPMDFVEHMVEIAYQHKIPKVGLSLKIDDLPDCNKHKEAVIRHESIFTTLGFIESPYGKVFKAPVDTTFGVCITSHSGMNGDAYRMDYPYMARHIPWYYDSDNLPEDEKLLRANKIRHIGQWSSM